MNGYENDVKEDSAFRRSFKFYKNKEKNVDFDGIIDVDQCRNGVRLLAEPEPTISIDSKKHLFLNDPKDWRIYSFEYKPGLLLARNIFTDFGHYFWSSKCLQSYPKSPNVSNIDQDLRKLTDFNGNILKYEKLVKKLRWVTFGYHHDWNTKVYSDAYRSDVPDDIQMLSRTTASILGFENFIAEAAIVNFYHLNSTLAGHVDHSERNMDPPLLSFSFGQSAVFLIGGITLDEEPMAVYLRSGDLVVMDKGVRLAYHAVPRIVKDFELTSTDSDVQMDLDVVEYISKNRININVRQVN